MKLLLALTALAVSLQAADSKGTFTNAADAGPDFAAQGEYVGDDVAAQVIALGDGKFRVIGYDHGLPGSDKSTKYVEIEGQREGDKIIFDQKGWKGEIVGNHFNTTDPEGQKFALTRTERKSSTLGAPPPAGALVLFDGKNADEWKGGKVDADGNLQCGVLSKREFGDITLHIEFRTPFQPSARGQGRGNSGVYLQNRYEVQVLDSFGLKGENNECGGIYTKHKPLVNMCFPPLSWQTYDIDYTAARYDAEGKKTNPAKLTVKHNGVLIHQDAEVSGATTSAGQKEGPELGPIQLQNHGNPVVYRNIWVVEKK